SMERILEVRKDVKQKVFVMNALRALEKVAPEEKLRKIPNVVLVGGSALDREIPDFIQEELAKYNIVSGRADIRASAGPRNAVATGLVISYLSEVTT
ncbi:MAG: diol dehydratase reactivase subunit alpha, partial [Vallitaleaceae bacterium]|nr:diol dehydratase reactivase subunit alpha [Vallitaleaceae bacterium]